MIRMNTALFLAFMAAACSGGPGDSGPESGHKSGEAAVSELQKQAVLPAKVDTSPVLLVLGGAISAARGLAPEASYAAILQNRLDGSGTPLRVFNASISGETVAGALERLPVLLAQPLQRAIIEAGQSDEARGTGPGAFGRDVLKLLQAIRSSYPQASVLVLPSAHAAGYRNAINEAAGKVEGVAVSGLLLEAGPSFRPDDVGLQHRLGEELFFVIERAGR